MQQPIDEDFVYHGIRDPQLLKHHHCFVAEGRSVVARVAKLWPESFVGLWLNEAACAAMERGLSEAGVAAPVYPLSAERCVQLTGHNFHRGCLAVVRRPPARPWQTVVCAASTVVLLEGVANPDNVGSVFRSAAALGASAILLGPGTGDPLYRKAIRTSVGAVFRMPYATLSAGQAEYREQLLELGQLGWTRLALSLREPSVELDQWVHSRRAQPPNERSPVALFVGAEGEGLGQVSEDCADERIRIAMKEGIDSLNVGVATALALHAVRRTSSLCVGEATGQSAAVPR